MEHLTSIVEKQENEISLLREEVTGKEGQLKGIKDAQTTDVESLKEMLEEANREIAKRRETRDSGLRDMEELMRKQEEEYKKIIAKKEQLISALTDEMEAEKSNKPGMKVSGEKSFRGRNVSEC